MTPRYTLISFLVFFLLSLPPLPMEKPSFHSLSASRGKFNEPPSSSISSYEPCPDLIAMVRELSFSGLSSENPDHHLREFEQLCSRFASASMKQDVLRWKLFPFSLKGKAEQWYTSYKYTAKGQIFTPSEVRPYHVDTQFFSPLEI